MANAMTVARVRGIPIRLHLTFVLLLPLFGYLMARAYFMDPGGSSPDAAGWFWGGLLAVGLFASVLMHELAHSLVALREGIGVRDILLLPIGGISSFTQVPREPGKELRITIVGPLSNFALGIPLMLAAAFLPQGPDWVAFLLRLGAINILIGAFNLLLPAFPMDGGRILRSLLARRLGYIHATMVAAFIGQAVALMMGILGVLAFASGGWLLMLVAGFVFIGAKAEARATRMSETLHHYRVRDVMTRDVETVGPDARAATALARMLASKHIVLPVAARGGRVLGVVDLERLESVPAAERETTTVSTLLRPEFATAHPDDDAAGLSQALSEGGPVLVFDEWARLVGIVTSTDIARFTRIALSTQGEGDARAA